MRTIAGRREALLHHPLLGIDAIHHTRRWDGYPQLAIAPFLTVRAGAERAAAKQLSRLEPPDLTGVGLRRIRSLLRRTLPCLRERTTARRRIAEHLIDHACPWREISADRLASSGIAVNYLAAVSGTDPQRAVFKCDAA